MTNCKGLWEIRETILESGAEGLTGGLTWQTTLRNPKVKIVMMPNFGHQFEA